MRAAALGSEELMRTGWEISILCLLLSWAALWLTDSAENECLFLAFFFPSPLLWPEPFPLDGEALGEGPGEQGPNGVGSELGPGTLVGVGLSISINCLAVSFNWEEMRRRRSRWLTDQKKEREGRTRGKRGEVQVLDFSSQWFTSITRSPAHTRSVFVKPFLTCSCWQLFKNQQHNNHHLQQLVQWDSLCVTHTLTVLYVSVKYTHTPTHKTT